MELKAKLIRMAEHHLSEAKGWHSLRREFEEKSDMFGIVFAQRKECAHVEMCEYFLDLSKSVRYVQGSWRQVCGHRA